MGTLQLILCIIVGHLVTVQLATRQQDAVFPQDFPGFLENLMAFPLEANFDMTPYDTIFSSRQTQTPDFHMLAELPPVVNVPRVQVFCHESTLTLLVDKRSNGVLLTGEDLQLGDGCYSNKELPNHFIFIYSLDQCGTTPVMQNGWKMFTNSLHLNLDKTPSTVHISCIPERSYDDPNYIASPARPHTDKSFNMKVMNPSWTGSADSNVYKRGQVANVQVSTKPRPGQQLFIQSCFLSMSPDPQTRPKHAVITNKGCTTMGSPYGVVKFVASDRPNTVNFVLNTSYVISELYIHCSVLTSDQGVTFGSKSCSYNAIHSRWEELSGDVEVCECCRSKCKGLQVKHLSEDFKAVVSAGPLVLVDKDVERSNEFSQPEETTSVAATNLQPDFSTETDNAIVSGTSVSRSQFSSPPLGVLVVNQDPVARLTLWLPGQVQDTEYSHHIASQPEDSFTHQLKPDYLPELQLSPTDQDSLLYPSKNQITSQDLNELNSESPKFDLNFHPLADDWKVPEQLGSTVFVEEFQRQNKFTGSGKTSTESQHKVNIPLSTEMSLNDLKNNFNQMTDELDQMQADAPAAHSEQINDVQPVIRSKIQFSKGVDGSHSLTYEEEVKDRKGMIGRCGMSRNKQEFGQKGLYSTFLNLLRRMDKAE